MNYVNLSELGTVAVDTATVIYTATIWHQLSNESRDLLYTFVLSSKEDYFLTPGENLQPPTAGSKSPRTGGAWPKCLHEEYAAQIRERILLGHLVCSKEILEKILESNTSLILESEKVTKIGNLYKIFLSNFLLICNSNAAKENLGNPKILAALVTTS